MKPVDGLQDSFFGGGCVLCPQHLNILYCISQCTRAHQIFACKLMSFDPPPHLLKFINWREWSFLLPLRRQFDSDFIIRAWFYNKQELSCLIRQAPQSPQKASTPLPNLPDPRCPHHTYAVRMRRGSKESPGSMSQSLCLHGGRRGAALSTKAFNCCSLLLLSALFLL